MFKRSSGSFISDVIDTNKGFDLSFLLLRLERWNLNTYLLVFSAVLLYMLYLWYLPIQYISYAEFFRELFWVDRQNGHEGKSCQ